MRYALLSAALCAHSLARVPIGKPVHGFICHVGALVAWMRSQGCRAEHWSEELLQQVDGRACV